MNKVMSVVAVCGKKGSGKTIVSNYLVHNGYQNIGFADPLKDIVSHLYSWDRSMLQGDLAENRSWREQTDNQWSNYFNKNITPRNALQDIGVMFREHYHPQTWCIFAYQKIQNYLSMNKPVVISDLRFINEALFLRQNFPTQIIRVVRDGSDNDTHISETELHQIRCDYTIINNGTIEQLYKDIDQLVNL